MPKIPVDKLLQPLPGDLPCGPDLDSDMTLGNLWREIETSAKGEAEQQFGDKVIEAKPADWKKVYDLSLDLLGQCRHLGAAIYLTAAALRTDGFTGFVQGLTLLHGLADGFWDDLHPLPDPDEPDDFFERVGLLDLMTPGYREGLVPDILYLVETLRTTPLARSPQAGPMDYGGILAHRSGTKGAPPAELISGVFNDADPAVVEKVRSDVEEAITLIGKLQELANERLKDDAPNFANVRKELEGITAALKEYTLHEAPAETPQAAEQQGTSAGVPAAAVSAPGTVASRADVVRTLNSVIAYYTANEPSSPIPFLLERAKQLVNNDFFGVIRNFRPDLEKDFLSLLGANQVDGGKPPPPPAKGKAPPPPQPPAQQPESEEADPWKNVRI